MNCKQAKAEIALWVGNDLNESAERSLRRHLSRCLGCRKHWRRMKASLRMLQEADEVPSTTEDVSLWPRLSAKLSAAEEQNARRSRFNGWVPALAVAAACLAMISLSNSTPPAERSSNTPAVPVQSAVHTEMPWRFETLPGTFSDVDPTAAPRGSIWIPHESEDDRSPTSPKKKTEPRIRY